MLRASQRKLLSPCKYPFPIGSRGKAESRGAACQAPVYGWKSLAYFTGLSVPNFRNGIFVRTTAIIKKTKWAAVCCQVEFEFQVADPASPNRRKLIYRPKLDPLPKPKCFWPGFSAYAKPVNERCDTRIDALGQPVSNRAVHHPGNLTAEGSSHE